MLSVLVVDDEEHVLNATRPFLERFGDMKVRTTRSAKEALSLLTTQVFDAIIVDYDMPEINGIEFLKILRGKGDTTPIILFTGVGREHAAIEALNNGANFFLKKGEDIQPQLREMVNMIQRAVEGRLIGKGLGTAQKILVDTVQFFKEPAFAIDREGKVLVWNDSIATLSGIVAADMIGKKEYAYAVPFFGRKAPLLVDMIFEEPEVIKKNNFTVISKEGGTITAWTKGKGADGKAKIWWMKAAPLYDNKGIFVGVLGAVRDITETLGPELLEKERAGAINGNGLPKEENPAGEGNMFDRLFGRAKAHYLEGLRLYYREGKYDEAIAAFDRAIEIEPTHAFAWHDKGVCLRALERNEEALAAIAKALEIAPDEEEILFTCAATLKKIGILRDDTKILSAAVDTYNRLLEKNPANAEAWNDIGICMQEMGRSDLSRQYFDRARDLKLFNKDKYRRRNIDALIR